MRATTASRSCGTSRTPAPSFPPRSSRARAHATSRRSSDWRRSTSTRTSPTRRWCCVEGDRAGASEAGHPRSTGPGSRVVAAPTRVLRRRGADRSCRRPRGRGVGRRVRARRGRADVRAAARESADRELRDRAHGDAGVTSPQPRVGVLRFPGACDDRDALWALAALDAEAIFVWHTETELPDLDAVVLPGGFSYGDYLRCGAIARFAPAMEAVTDFAAAGGLVLGICNGFQILCEAGLLPGVLRRNESLSFVCRDVPLSVERADTPFTTRCEEGQVLTIPVKHGEGSWYADDDLYAELEARKQIVLRYTEPVNGSRDDVAGVVNERGNVMGLMPHPEHAVDPLLGSADGALILSSLVESARQRFLATV